MVRKIKLLQQSATHYKFLDETSGKEYLYPRVTVIFNDLQLMNFDRVSKRDLERSQKFGRAVHKAIDLYDRGKLHYPIDKKLSPYLEAYIKFRNEISWAKDIEFNETFVYSHAWKYGGTLDKIFKDLILVDFKTGSSVYHKVTKLQMSAYSQAFKETYGRCIRKRFSVWLKPDSYSIKEYEDKDGDLYKFLSCMTVYNLKKGA
jgi:hypothetical protein